MSLISFQKFIFRCPIYPLNAVFQKALDKVEKEAIFLASPDLFAEFSREEISTQNRSYKIAQSLLKYRLRMRSRCTPFGIFAGCGIGDVGDRSEIILATTDHYESHTRLDMQFLCSLIQAMEMMKDKLFYYPNSSLYKILDSYRYVEYHYVGGERRHDLSEVEADDYLEKVLDLCRDGSHYSHIVEEIAKQNDIDVESVTEYVDNLILNQILVSNIHPRVTGEDLLCSIIATMDELNFAPPIRNILIAINEQIASVDSLSLGRDLRLYEEIEKKVQLLDTEYEKRFLFQTDTYVTSVMSSISSEIIETVKVGIAVLNKMIPRNDHPYISDFVKEFYKRYEDEEIPLVEALDPDFGIGFGNVIPGNVDFHPLINNIQESKSHNIELNEFSKTELLLYRKYCGCLERGDHTITLTDNDFEEFSFDLDDLPPTFSTLIEVVQPEASSAPPIIILRLVGGSSAANLIGRFAHINPDIRRHVEMIIEQENQIIGPNKIIAEIVHLPKSRVGNVLFRPVLRKYEIPYLAKESVTGEFAIPITDLMISVKGGKTLHLRSRKLNKEIVPRLTTAHNFSRDSLPIYHFLSALQATGTKSDISFRWGSYFESVSFLPRVVYKNIIFSLATWKFKKRDLLNLPKIGSSDFVGSVASFKRKNNLPDLVSLVSDDNKLLIDLNDRESQILLFNEIKDQDFILEEFIDYSKTSLIKRQGDSFRNEILLGFYKNEIT
jgi:hypothetical protein